MFQNSPLKVAIQNYFWKKADLQISVNFPGDYLFSTQEIISEKLTFLTPWHALIRVRIRELEMLVFRKILRTY